jgi:endonuclease/exonuclease/phosphatase (EEP) superfamily protein YafD
MTLNQIITLAQVLLNLTAGAATIATILGFSGGLSWIFELMDHPRPQYCLILVFAIVVGGIYRQAWSFLWLIPLILNLVVILPLFFAPTDIVSQIKDTPFRIIHINLDRHNLNTTPAIDYMEKQDVDLIFLQEVTSKWLTDLESNLSRYRIVTSLPQENSLGVAMLVPIQPSSTMDIVSTQIIHLPSYSDRPLIETTWRWEDKDVVILSLSLIRPRNSSTSVFQKIELNAVADWSLNLEKDQKHDAIVIGDFNNTPWSSQFREFLHKSNLINSQRGFGLQPTWLAGLPSFLGIPIDHCLHSKSIVTVNRGTGPNIGSDHLPVFVELQKRI